MANSKDRDVAFQKLDNGTYRVVGAMRRSAVTGRFVTESASRRSPSTRPSESGSTRPAGQSGK